MTVPEHVRGWVVWSRSYPSEAVLLVCDLLLWLCKGHVPSSHLGPTESQDRGVWAGCVYGKSYPDTLRFPRRLCLHVSLPATSRTEGGGPQASPQSPVGLCCRAASTALLRAGAEWLDSPDDGRTVMTVGPTLRDMDTHIMPALKIHMENVHRHRRQRGVGEHPRPRIGVRRVAQPGGSCPEVLAEEGVATRVMAPQRRCIPLSAGGRAWGPKEMSEHSRAGFD